MSASADADAAPVGSARRRLLLNALGLSPLLAMPLRALAKAEPLEPDEDVLFIPSIARELEDGRIEVEVQAWILERDRHRMLDAGLARYLGLDLGRMSPAARLRFHQRTALFHAEPEQGTVLDISFGHGTPVVAMPSSDSAGRTQLRVTLPNAPAPLVDLPDPRRVLGRPSVPWLYFHALVAGPPPRRIEGRALRVSPEGLSVVSDIDDTVKITQVRDQREMLLNTFARPFEAVPGMAAHFRALAGAAGSTRFHYLSSSPMQLLPALDDFLRQSGFPGGSMHLRESTHWRQLIPQNGASREHKRSTLLRLLADFPKRHFLLVGDSGESDPEIYGELAREHPARVQAIVIRDVSGDARDGARYQAAFADVPAERWHLLADGQPWPVPR